MASRGASIATATINRQAVKSSSLASAGYAPVAQILEVEFRNGRVYRYFGVPPEAYKQFLSAESRGRYLNRFIKGHYRYVRI